MATKAIGDVVPNQPIPQNVWQNVWRRSSSIGTLPIDWKAQGIDSQTVRDFASYLDCVETNRQSPDECVTDSNKAQGKDFEIVFDRLYWLPDIEPALFNQLEKYKPQDCSAVHATCTASTPDNICPPWRVVVPERSSTDAGREDSGEQFGTNTNASGTISSSNIASSVIASSTHNSTIHTQPMHTRPVEVTRSTSQTPASAYSTSGSTSLTDATTTGSTDRNTVYGAFVPTSTPENGAVSYSLGRLPGLPKLVVPAIAGLFLALL